MELTMGFTLDEDLYHLTFAEGTPYHGFEALLSDMSIREALAFDRLYLTVPTDPGDGEQWVREIFTVFVEHLVEWNLQDADGTLVKPTVEAILDSRYRKLMNALIPRWVRGMRGDTDDEAAADPLGAGGWTEADIPMQPPGIG
jgi:hypothetical protein